MRPLHAADAPKVAHIAVAADQEKFSGTVAEAFAEDPKRFDLHGIADDDRLIGIFKIDKAYHMSIPWHPHDGLGLRAFMIDHRCQGRGLATQTVQKMGPYLAKHYPLARTVTLTVNQSNPAAIKCYLNGGFTDTGRIFEGGSAGPQRVMRMDL